MTRHELESKEYQINNKKLNSFLSKINTNKTAKTIGYSDTIGHYGETIIEVKEDIEDNDWLKELIDNIATFGGYVYSYKAEDENQKCMKELELN